MIMNKNIEFSDKNLKQVKTFFLVIALLSIIAGCIKIYAEPTITTTTIMLFVLAALNFTYANRCDTLIMRKKVEAWVSTNLKNKEDVYKELKEQMNG